MPEFGRIGKILIIIGMVIVVLGLPLAFDVRILLLGKLPGDILIEKDSISFYFPIVSFLLLSIVGIIYLVLKTSW